MRQIAPITTTEAEFLTDTRPTHQNSAADTIVIWLSLTSWLLQSLNGDSVATDIVLEIDEDRLMSNGIPSFLM
jgi:hypothetical protein